MPVLFRINFSLSSDGTAEHASKRVNRFFHYVVWKLFNIDNLEGASRVVNDSDCDDANLRDFEST